MVSFPCQAFQGGLLLENSDNSSGGAAVGLLGSGTWEKDSHGYAILSSGGGGGLSAADNATSLTQSTAVAVTPGAMHYALRNWNSSFVTTKVARTASTLTLYDDCATETTGWIDKGPVGTMANSITATKPATMPTLGQVLAAGTIGTNAFPWTWVLPALSPAASPITFAGPTQARTVTIADAAQTLLNSTASGVQTFLTTPSSANLLAAVTDETGSASGTPLLVFNQSPVLVAPSIGAATGTSLILTGTVNAGADVNIVTDNQTVIADTVMSHVYINNVGTTTAKNYILPATATSKQLCFKQYPGNTGVITLHAKAGQYVTIPSTNVFTATDKGIKTSSGAATDFVCLQGIDATHWMSFGYSGAWATE